MGRAFARMEEGRIASKILRGKPSRKRPLGRSRRRWEDNIRTYLKEISVNTRDWTNLVQDGEYWRPL